MRRFVCRFLWRFWVWFWAGLWPRLSAADPPLALKSPVSELFQKYFSHGLLPAGFQERRIQFWSPTPQTLAGSWSAVGLDPGHSSPLAETLWRNPLLRWRSEPRACDCPRPSSFWTDPETRPAWDCGLDWVWTLEQVWTLRPLNNLRLKQPSLQAQRWMLWFLDYETRLEWQKCEVLVLVLGLVWIVSLV